MLKWYKLLVNDIYLSIYLFIVSTSLNNNYMFNNIKIYWPTKVIGAPVTVYHRKVQCGSILYHQMSLLQIFSLWV
jgi:hypothetical protein